MKINWYKIIGNAGLAFFTSAIGLTAAGTLLSLEIPIQQYMIVVLVVSGGHGGAAFFRELTKQSENPPIEKVHYKNQNKKQFDKLTDNPESIKKSKINKIHYVLKNITL